MQKFYPLSPSFLEDKFSANFDGLAIYLHHKVRVSKQAITDAHNTYFSLFTLSILYPVMTTGEKIKYFRKRSNLTQEKMAELLDIQPVSYGRIERDESDISISRLEQIADVLKVPLWVLLSQGENQYFQINGNQINDIKDGSSLVMNIENSTIYRSVSDEMKELAHQNELLQIEKAGLERELANLKEMIALIRKSPKTN